MTTNENKLRIDRNEMPAHDLNPLETKERAWKLEKYEQWKSEVSFPASACDRQKTLLLEWASHESYEAGRILSEQYPNWREDQDSFYVDNEAWVSLHRLWDHAKYCPQCVVFPVPVPFMKT
jgi:hypothetical protein